jgi:hypothetical protein
VPGDVSGHTTLGLRSIRAAITCPSTPSTIPREISSRSVSVSNLRWATGLLLDDHTSPGIYSKINYFDRLGSRGPAARDQTDRM